jgi:hypothetical protein
VNVVTEDEDLVVRVADVVTVVLEVRVNVRP